MGSHRVGHDWSNLAAAARDWIRNGLVTQSWPKLRGTSVKGFWLLKAQERRLSFSFALAGSVSNAWNLSSHLATNLRMSQYLLSCGVILLRSPPLWAFYGVRYIIHNLSIQSQLVYFFIAERILMDRDLLVAFLQLFSEYIIWIDT